MRDFDPERAQVLLKQFVIALRQLEAHLEHMSLEPEDKKAIGGVIHVMGGVYRQGMAWRAPRTLG